MRKVFIHKDPLYYSYVKHTLDIFSNNKGISLVYVDSKEEADIIIDTTADSHFTVCKGFYKAISGKQFDHAQLLDKNGMVSENGKTDILATCFYMINSLQEYTGHGDIMGRFPYEQSYQKRFGSIRKNLVQGHFNEMAKQLGLKPNSSEKTSVFLSHDVDNITSAWIEDGFAALRSGKIASLARLLVNAAIGKPDWFNMDLVMNLHDEYKMKSTFFWIAKKGKTPEGWMNADYDIKESRIQESINAINKRGFGNGMHKSVSSEGFDGEIKNMGFQPTANRYHFLKFNLPSGYDQIEAAGLKMDASLGFSEEPGFRNSYGRPFQPCNLKTGKAYDFIEVPLHIMDRTYYRRKEETGNISKEVISFFESNKEDCVISLLWHNNFFNSLKYKGYMEEYKKIIAYLYESGIRSVTVEGLISRYRIV